MRVKICGITNIEDALLCSELGADALGFIFYDKSKRFIQFENAQEIIRQLPAFVVKVGVFVDENPDKINKAALQIGLNAVQLHGDETIESVSQIQLPVIKGFRVKENFDWSVIDSFQNYQILLDAYSRDQMGGTGKSFYWNTIPERIKSRIILSGGIKTEKLEYIFNEVKPAAIDLSSSLESIQGKKNKKKVEEFFKKYHELKGE